VKSAVIRRDTAGGRPVWVIGAAAGDLTSDQLWIDAQRWTPVRLIDRETRGTRTTITDYRFSEFVEHGGMPIVTTLLIYRDQRLTVRYEHRDIRINPTVSDAAFDPARWVEGQPPLPVTTPSTTPRSP
jgi:outer membrane lipoprotein-sorting protein